MKKVILMFLALAQLAFAESYFMTVGTGGVSGAYYPVGVAIGKVINIERREHGIRVSVVQSGGSIDNINGLRKGLDTMAMAMVQSDVQYNTYNGEDTNLRALFGLYSEPYTVIARKDSGVSSFDQLSGKRFNIGNRGSGNRNTTDTLLAAYGWNTGRFAKATELSAAEMVVALCENRIDAFAYVVGNPNSAIEEALACNAQLVQVSGESVDALVTKYPYLPKAIIAGGTYSSISTDTASFGPKATFVTTADLPEEVAYQVTKAVYENLEKLRAMHPALASMKHEDMLSGNTAPYHPGALRFYKEVGLIK